MDFPGGSVSKASAYNAGDPGSIPGSGRSPGEGNGYPGHYSCLGNPMDGGVWWASVQGVAELNTTERLHFHFLAVQWSRLCTSKTRVMGSVPGQETKIPHQFSSVQFSCSVVSDSLRSHESQHARPPCPSPTPGVHSDSRPSSQ